MENETSRIAELEDRVELLEKMVTELRADRYGREAEEKPTSKPHIDLSPAYGTTGRYVGHISEF